MTPEEKIKILEASGFSRSDLARALQISRVTVRKLLEDIGSPPLPLYKVGMESTLVAIRKALDNGTLPTTDSSKERRTALLKKLINQG